MVIGKVWPFREYCGPLLPHTYLDFCVLATGNTGHRLVDELVQHHVCWDSDDCRGLLFRQGKAFLCRTCRVGKESGVGEVDVLPAVVDSIPWLALYIFDVEVCNSPTSFPRRKSVTLVNVVKLSPRTQKGDVLVIETQTFPF